VAAAAAEVAAADCMPSEHCLSEPSTRWLCIRTSMISSLFSAIRSKALVTLGISGCRQALAAWGSPKKAPASTHQSDPATQSGQVTTLQGGGQEGGTAREEAAGQAVQAGEEAAGQAAHIRLGG
jgi:hypothetical protein